MTRNDYLEWLVERAQAYWDSADKAESQMVPKNASDYVHRKFEREWTEAHPFPLTDGENAVRNAYLDSVRRGNDRLVFHAIAYDFEGMVAAIREAGLPGFLIVNQAVGMREALQLEKAGAHLEGIESSTTDALHGNREERGFWFTV